MLAGKIYEDFLHRGSFKKLLRIKGLAYKDFSACDESRFSSHSPFLPYFVFIE